jgi:hypothetical protein
MASGGVSELYYLRATEMADLLRTRQISAVELRREAGRTWLIT